MVGGLIRVFIAAPVPEEIKTALADRLADLKVPGKPVPPANWHFTLRFLGDVEEVTLERLLAALDQSDLRGRFAAELGHMGAFPRAPKASVLWVGLTRGAAEMSQLAALANEAAEEAGLPSEERPFQPHLTLSRIRPPEDVTDLVDGTSYQGIEWRCQEIVVYESRLGRPHPIYEPLETFTLAR